MVAVDTLPGAGQRVDPVAPPLQALRARLIALDQSLWPLTAVLTVYVLAAILLPTMTPVAISDDWTYARSVEYLVLEGKFHVLPVAAAIQIFQLFWGASFAVVFGMTFGALRLSTVVLVFISGIAFFALCRELGVTRARSALGTAAYLFNPVLFPITYTFMSDPHFLALLVLAAYGYVRGLRPGVAGERATVAGSAVAALASLQRPHGVLIPLGVVTYLVLTRQLGLDRASFRRLVRIVAIPAATFLTYYLVISRGVPTQQELFLGELKAAGPAETWLLFRRLTVMEMVYTGLFVLPIVAGVVGSAWQLASLASRRAWALFCVWEGILIAGVAWFWLEGRRMPYIPHFLGRAGPGSGDLRNSRPPIASAATFDWVTIVCAAAALLFGLILIRAIDHRPARTASGAGMALAIAGWQVLGVLPQSFLFRNWIVSLDRYLLPILPFVILLLLWALDRISFQHELAWLVTAGIALFSIVGTRDALVFQNDVWAIATQLNQHGVPNTRLDAGYAWDAYHLWEFGEAYDIQRQTLDGTWWTDVYAKPTDSTYVIAGGPIPGYTILSVHPYSAWLQRQPVALYVLRRDNAQPDGVVWP